ncbi:MAG: AAA family ATPase [Desulfovibrionaceae bacterium]|nr:AAA family ATPase [Desulfovibrionaceae bacterium]
MEHKEYLPRIIDSTVRLYLSTFGAVCIEGPKWCGKTWTSIHHSRSRVFLSDPVGNFQNRRLAEISPDLILEGDKPRLIDEWQEFPPLWDAVRHAVDQSPEKGQFILTGSSTPPHKGILHSGAGRIAKLRMRPMSLFESGDSSGRVSLQDLCQGHITPCFTGDVDLRHLAELILRGGWPEILGLPLEKAVQYTLNCLDAIIDDDAFRLDGIKRNTAKMRLLLRSLARNESTAVSNRALKNDIRDADAEDIDVETIAGYLDIFERVFVTDNQLPFSEGPLSSVRRKKAVKRHLADPSFACALLQITTSKALIDDLDTFAFLFEALCERDLKIYAESFGGRLYHYQDYKNRQIDAVIALPGGQWCAFEIALGASEIDAAACKLLKLQKSLQQDEKGKPMSVMCVICGMASAAYQRPDGVFVVPVTALKN